MDSLGLPLSQRKVLWLVVGLVMVAWVHGVYRGLRIPAPAVESVPILADAQVLAIAPDFIYFELPVSRSLQQRFVQRLELVPIPFDAAQVIPVLDGLATWPNRSRFVAAPYAVEAVQEWWQPRRKEVRFGFVRQVDATTALYLDLESSVLIGYGEWATLRDIL